jgi:hypothetical protein
VTVLARPPVTRPAGSAAAAAVVALGMAALLARPPALAAVPHPVAFLVLLFVALGVAGVAWPLPSSSEPPVSRASALVVLSVGVGAFAAGRLLGGGPTAPLAGTALVLNTLAAVAEEAFFRRLAYGALAPWGSAVAVAGSALAFAVVHVTVWGAGVLPLDLAAGLLLSWQRAASGRWAVPAATHTVANLLAAL